MTAFKPSADHLEELIKNRKYKEFDTYIELIQNQDGQAEKAVAKNLKKFLVQKASKIPVHLFNTLVLYKKLMMSAAMDFITSDDFPQQIHEQIAKICEYKGTEQFTSSRGAFYFIDIFGLERSDEFERAGAQYVLLALELIKSLAKWYPVQYDDKTIKSTFRTQYQKLLQKKVTFPNEDEFKLIKPTDQQLFKDKYRKFLESVNNEDNNQEQTIPKGTKQSNKNQTLTQVKSEQRGPNNSLNVDSSSILQKKDISKFNHPEMIPLSNQNLVSLQIPSKKPGSSGAESGRKSKIEESKVQSISKPNEKGSMVGNQIDKPKTEEKREASKIVQKKEASKIVQKKLPVEKSRGPEQSSKISIDSLELPQASKINKILNSKNNQVVSPSAPVEQIRIQRSQIKKQSVAKQQPKSKVEVELPKPPSKLTTTIQQKEQFSSKFHQQQQISIPPEPKHQKMQFFSFTNKQPQPAQRKKIYKMEKPRNFYSDRKSPQKKEMSPHQQNKKKSIPKTQKVHNYLNMTGPMAVAKKIVFDLDQPLYSNEFAPKKTLSYFANSRKKAVSTQFQKYCTIFQAIQSMKLDKHILAYHSQYFEPLTPKMHSLRASALNLFNSGQSFDYFYKSNLIECRLIKQSEFLFHLSIHNISNSVIHIDSVDMSQIKYSNRIKILTWGNKQEIYPYQLVQNGHMDIKFAAQIYDFNFKFLDFLVYVNQKVQVITLPLTLLDMCKIQTSLTLKDIHRYSLKGSIIASKPFILSNNGLPSFLGNFKFPTLQLSRQKRESNQLIGHCTFKLEMANRYEYYMNEICLIVKILSWQSHMVEINILYPTKDIQGESFSKVLMYLMIFLLGSS